MLFAADCDCEWKRSWSEIDGDGESDGLFRKLINGQRGLVDAMVFYN